MSLDGSWSDTEGGDVVDKDINRQVSHTPVLLTQSAGAVIQTDFCQCHSLLLLQVSVYCHTNRLLSFPHTHCDSLSPLSLSHTHMHACAHALLSAPTVFLISETV